MILQLKERSSVLRRSRKVGMSYPLTRHDWDLGDPPLPQKQQRNDASAAKQQAEHLARDPWEARASPVDPKQKHPDAEDSEEGPNVVDLSKLLRDVSRHRLLGEKEEDDDEADT